MEKNSKNKGLKPNNMVNRRKMSKKCTIMTEVLSDMRANMLLELYATEMDEYIKKDYIKDRYSKSVFSYLSGIKSLNMTDLEVINEIFNSGVFGKAISAISLDMKATA